MTNIKQEVLSYKDWYRDDIHFGYIFNVTHFKDKSWIIKIDAVPSTHTHYKILTNSRKGYMYFQTTNECITGFGIVNDIQLALNYYKKYPSPYHIDKYIKPLLMDNCSYYITSSKLTKQGRTIIYNLVTSKQDSNILIAFEMCKNLIREREDKLVKEVV